MTHRQILRQLAEAGRLRSKTSTTLPWSTYCATNLSP
jgi:hypothetical protein